MSYKQGLEVTKIESDGHGSAYNTTSAERAEERDRGAQDSNTGGLGAILCAASVSNPCTSLRLGSLEHRSRRAF